VIASRWTDALRGLDVALTTTVSRSSRDESFGFGKGIAGVQVQAPESQAGPARQREAEAE